MKSIKEIKDEILKEGIHQRLEALSQERGILIKLLRGSREYDNKQKQDEVLAAVKKIKRKSRKGKRYNGTHWTQQPENRTKLVKMVRENWKRRQQS